MSCLTAATVLALWLKLNIESWKAPESWELCYGPAGVLGTLF